MSTRQEKAERNKRKIEVSVRREIALRRLEDEVDKTVEEIVGRAVYVGLQCMDIDTLEGIVKLVQKARSDGWNEGSSDTEREYDERL